MRNPSRRVEAQPSGAAACPTEIGVIFLPLEGVVDAATERKRLEGEMAKVRTEMDKVARKLASDPLFRMRHRKSFWITGGASKHGQPGWTLFAELATPSPVRKVSSFSKLVERVEILFNGLGKVA